MKLLKQPTRALAAFVAAAALVACSSGAASAATVSFQAILSGLEEAPPNASPGSGSVVLDLDTVSGAVLITSGNYLGLVAPSTAAHIHGPSAPGVNSGVLIGLTLVPAGVTAGTIAGGGVLSAANVTNMINGLTYVNLHSSAFPGGEIRGQLYVVPEPGTLGLGAIAVLTLAAGAWRRRRRV